MKEEQKYLKLCRNHPDEIYTAVSPAEPEGFAELKRQGYSADIGGMLRSLPVRDVFTMMGIMLKWMPKTDRGKKESFRKCLPYLKELEEKGKIVPENSLLQTFPNKEIWKEITRYAYERWKCLIGFTHVPRELIFRDKAILFEYALVVIMEMQKDKIHQAPGAAAGEEAQRVYAGLGEAVNDIASCLRKTWHIKCQSHHPLGGLVNDCALAVKAGLGFQGRNGLLITPQFGQRQRIASIFVQEPYFEASDIPDYTGEREFCSKCGKCIRICPVQAIYPEKRETYRPVEGIGATYTCIDRYRCYRQFEKTLGCSLCIRACPFSDGTVCNQSYTKGRRIDEYTDE